MGRSAPHVTARAPVDVRRIFDPFCTTKGIGEGKITAVLTDLMTPVIDGIAAIRAFRVIDPALRSIAAIERTARRAMGSVASFRITSAPHVFRVRHPPHGSTSDP